MEKRVILGPTLRGVHEWLTSRRHRTAFFATEEEEEEPYLRVNCMFVRCPTYCLHLYPCTLPTAPVSRSTKTKQKVTGPLTTQQQQATTTNKPGNKRPDG